MKDKIILFLFWIFFSISILFFINETYLQIKKNISEKEYYLNLYNSYINLDNSNKVIKRNYLINDRGITITVSKLKNIISYNKLNKKNLLDKKINYSQLPKDLDFKNSKLYIPWFLSKEKGATLIFPKDDKSIYTDLKKGVRVSVNSVSLRNPWIVFIEGHSWQNYKWTLNYSYFDNLSLYYNEVSYWQLIYIKTKDYLFTYELFKKEIISPWNKDFYQSNYHHLILMTCYPRNTSQKRALFHSKLISIKKNKNGK